MQQRGARRAESQGMWRGDVCKARKWAPMESRKLTRKGPRFRSSSRAEKEGFQKRRGRGEEGGRGYFV